MAAVPSYGTDGKHHVILISQEQSRNMQKHQDDACKALSNASCTELAWLGSTILDIIGVVKLIGCATDECTDGERVTGIALTVIGSIGFVLFLCLCCNKK